MRAWFRGWLVILALVIAAGALGYLSTRQVWTADWSNGQRASLSQASRAVLARLHGPVKITSYARPGNDQRRQITAFIARYQRFKPDITLNFVDPSLDPAATRAAGITVNGELVIDYQGRQRLLPQIDERHLTNALESLARGGARIVAFVTGDGERGASGQQPADLGNFVGQLEKRGIRAVPLNFAQVPQVPQGTSVVVLASPLTALPTGAVQALVTYVRDGGNLLWLADPGSGDLGLASLADTLGIQKLPGVLVDGQGTALGLSDPRLVAVALYPPQAITQGFKLSTLFPQVAALAQTSMGSWKVSPILRSSAQSWSEREPIDDTHTSTIRYDADQGDTKGPLNFGLALTRLSPGPGHRQQRVVVIGDGDFLSNAFLGKGGNRAFGERVFNWLLGDDVLIGVPPRQAASVPLALTQGGLNLFTIVFLVALPILLALIGLILGWRRRRH
ncbi:MAG TPA: GldG family protein [Oleiagrimonas sp.]|nr:GldG family protein [Oleiagrimonas sp.]